MRNLGGITPLEQFADASDDFADEHGTIEESGDGRQGDRLGPRCD